ncbi:LysR family transcriptional regulator [Shewanella inventionis]|uniref:LysR family transcriptional regulator n=1 Tax=Shewanella inventionis TaxID=1738770 RepID=A0ABQ1IVZ0_9GAMM|nr:LysR family transcriptional regulator [Shewanella inventionis]MCL1156891.1 LysR family transcriptional regulator [Shewanella inventionis]UAL45175.1 LysR family transcriptional regulator [Shewanella inventionis]GGB50923.1 LysR family transcriptional regulator [Shewanella inventionis]
MKTEDIALFHRIVETGSILEAANLLNLPKSTVSRRLLSLEESLNIKLFHRLSRSILLTSAGSHFYEKTLLMLADLDQTIADITDNKAELSGHIRILMFPVPQIMNIVSKIFAFMDANPKLSIEIITSTEPLDMVRNNIDIAFMVNETFTELDMVAKPILSEEMCFFASPDYLAKAGTPNTITDIEQHNSILFRFPNGKTFSEVPLANDAMQAVTGNLCTNSIQLAYEATRLGRGIGYLPQGLCHDDVEQGRLIRLFNELQPYVGVVFLVYPSRRFLSLTAQRLLDYMLNELPEQPHEKSDQHTQVWI